MAKENIEKQKQFRKKVSKKKKKKERKKVSGHQDGYKY